MSRNRLVALLTALLTLAALLISGCTQATPTTVAPAALNISTSTLPNAIIGISYSQTLNVAGGTGPYTWKVSDGSLPSGFSLYSKTGSISGMPATSGTYNFTAEVNDSAGTRITKAFSITINAASVPLTSGTSFLPTGEAGVAYSQTLKAYGGAAPYTWSIISETLPPNLTLDEKTGVISGTLQNAGKFIIATKVVDSKGAMSTESLTLTVNPHVSVATPGLNFGEAGIIFSQRLEATDGIGDYKWSISGGKLPEGLDLNASTGEITGTPNDAGNYTLTMMVTDSVGATGTQPFTIEIKTNVAMTTTSLPDGKIGQDYSQIIQFTGGNGEFVVAVLDGALPDGLTLDGSTGKISGKPKIAGPAEFTIEVIDSWGSLDKKELSITVVN
jgi:hypothetical protein